MSWVCFCCDEIVYDDVYPWGDVYVCHVCHHDFLDVRKEEE